MSLAVEMSGMSPPLPGEQPGPPTLAGLFRRHRSRILRTYSLFAFENVLGLCMPLALGLAFRGLCARSWRGLAILLAAQLALLGVAVTRRMYDTRTYTAAYRDLAGRLVLGQRRAVPLSMLAARSALAQQLVDFLETNLPTILQTISYVVGAMVMLALADGWLVVSCLALIGPAFLTGRRYGRRTAALNARLHDQMEREVQVIERGTADEVIEHYQCLSDWRVKLSDLNAMNTCFIQACSLGLIAVALARTCLAGETDAGRITMVLGYVGMYVQGLLSLPTLLEQYGRLRDIGQRIRGDQVH
jgi:hypothetical protein